jgi:hypothetical protein
MCIISVESQPTMKINIHNQCSDFKLKDERMFSNGLDWNKFPDDEVDAGCMISVDLISPLVAFGGIVMYQIQRKCVRSDDQLESTYTLLFIAWKSEGYKKFCVFVRLIDCDKTFPWHKIDQKEYYKRYINQFSTYTCPIKDTLLTRNGTVLMTRLDLDFTQRDGVLSLIISEGIRDDHTKIPELIDSKM